ncbi:MAG: hypothetical protein MUO39_03890 [Steroidobacteraceae bacterium]|nr:hypothetical protein [Steroidobacteraceae bacterium]
MIRDLIDRTTDRRKFLRDIAAAGGLVAVASSAGATAVAPTAAPVAPASKPTGYRVTAHVSKYYDKARI